MPGPLLPVSGTPYNPAMTDTAPLRLADGAATLELLPALGGTILRYEWHGVPVLRPTDGTPTQARLAACYPLVPYSNRIAGGHLAFEGGAWPIPRTVDYAALPMHGLAWQRPWTVTRHDATRAVLEQRYAMPDADAPWPFPFHATQTFELAEDTLRLTLTLRNTGATAQPAGLGWHPYFPRTPQARVRAKVSHMWVNDDQNLPQELMDTGGAVDDGLPVAQVDLDNVFNGYAGSASVAWPERGMAVDLVADTPLGHLVIFTPPDKPYFAVEPVSHMTDAFNRYARDTAPELTDIAPGVRQDRATGTLVVAPGAQATATLTMRPRRLR